MNQHLRAVASLLITIFIAALVTVLAKLSLSRVSPFTFNWLQITCALTFLTGYSFFWKKAPWPSHLTLKQWLYVGAIGFCNFTLVRYLFLAGLEELPVSTHAYLVSFVGLITMVLSAFINHEKPFLIQVIGALIALSGVTLFFNQYPNASQWKGILYVVCGVFFLALTNNLIRRFMVKHSQHLSAHLLSTLAIWIGGLPLVIAGIWLDDTFLTLSPTDYLVIMANGIFSLALTLIVFNHVLKVLKSYEASILASSGLIFTALLAIPIAKEVLSVWQLSGIIILFIGIILSQLKVSIFKFKKKTS